jgi:hypothetical protein
LAQLAEQFTIIEKITAKNFRNAENIVTMRYRMQYILLQVISELYYLFRMARWTEITTASTEGQKIFAVTIRTTDSSEPLVEIPTFQKLPYYKGDYRSIETGFFEKSSS